ncbi:MAG: hypothetical protein QM635_06810 [Microbacteriaceae bacterium]
MIGAGALAVLRATPPGSRVVVRRLLADGMASDAVGELEAVDGQRCVVVTARGPVTIELAAVIAARAVPPPARRRGG